MEGFLVNRWMDRWSEGTSQIFTWIKEGHVKNHETITEGFENLPATLIGLWRGANVGKALVRV